VDEAGRIATYRSKFAASPKKTTGYRYLRKLNAYTPELYQVIYFLSYENKLSTPKNK